MEAKVTCHMPVLERAGHGATCMAAIKCNRPAMGAESCCMATQERNVHQMKLVEGAGNTYDSNGKALEGDKFNTVFIVVSLSSLRAGHRLMIR